VRVLTAEDVAGPFHEIPDDVYQKAELDCLCYRSLSEKLAELAHTTPDVLRMLNGETDLNSLGAGDSIRVPIVGRFADAAADAGGTAPAEEQRAIGAGARGQRTDTAGGRGERANRPESTMASPRGRSDTIPGGEPSSPVGDSVSAESRAPVVARIIVSDAGRYLHALDAAGRIVYHFPATIGSDYFPSPTGEYHVTSVTEDPWFHYQPALLEGEDPDAPTARLAPGPNSPVGTVWIALSKEHFGIHGTDSPETIGYVTSSGCVRLTNWNAALLARSIRPGVVVEFTDVARDPQGAPPDSARPAPRR
jgi:lipoprotein-anchoring transpeptidase ErfK/SrfK